ncbi:GOLPH3/VPS74 family protein, partial [Actinopolyspora mortivallis]
MHRVTDRSRFAFGLPGELVLLAHKPRGGHYAINTDVVVAAAEVGELVLRERVTLTGTRRSDFRVRLDDETSTGLSWLDEVLHQLRRKIRSSTGSVSLTSWFHARNGVFDGYRARLVDHGALRAERRSLLGIRYHRYFPEERQREQLLDQVRAVADHERAVDNRTALLAALIHGSGLQWGLGLDRAQRRTLRALGRGEALGEAVDPLVTHASVALAAAGGGASDGGGGGD